MKANSNRRDFLKSTGCMALAAGVAGSGPIAHSVSAAEIKEPAMEKNPSKYTMNGEP